MYQYDFEDFVYDITWFLKEDDNVEILEINYATDGLFNPTYEFKAIFPTLTKLLQLARVTRLRVNEEEYQLYGWTSKEGYSLGWLCSPPSKGLVKSELLPDHKLLLSCFGGIRERWHEPEEDNWLINLNSALCEHESNVGFNGWEENFFEFCSWDNLKPNILPKGYVAFAFEANGDSTIYHKVTGQVLMYAHDHCFEHITQVEGCPEYTLYTINDCPDFRGWVETVARQWLKHADT